jgi:hypothetical protein
MNFLKKGPELKLSELKVPDPVIDVYYDLKERHLLPLVAILLVAMVAVPIALSQAPGSEEAGEGGGEAAATPSTPVSRGGQLVATSTPGLRDFHRRLRDLHAKDPFKQQYSEEEGASEGEGGGASSSEGGEGTAEGSSGGTGTPSEAIPPPSSSPGTAPTEEGTPGPGKLTYYSYAIDVRVSAGGSAGESSGGGKKATVRRNLPELTMLPSRETPAVMYMGSTKDGKKALMLVSSNVTSIFGDAKCVLGSQTCELIAIEQGLPETFVYGATGRTYKIELLKIHLVETDKLNRAPLGKPKKHGKGH